MPKTWKETFPDNKVDIRKFIHNDSYNAFFEQPYIQKILDEINEKLSEIMETIGDAHIFPYPTLLFKTLNMLRLEDILVVIMGQDPYFNFAKKKKQELGIPEATGKSFSVPKNTDIPSSLKNIYKNLNKYNHFIFEPKHGDLTFWNLQGCLMLNTSLSVQHGHANSHEKIWSKLTNELIRWISKQRTNLVFVLWGKNAAGKKLLINKNNNHEAIISSHPCGMSSWKTQGQYPAFDNVDHFGLINEYLIKHDKQPICWQIS
jgi:uracil-DNA glycosylase